MAEPERPEQSVPVSIDEYLTFRLSETKAALAKELTDRMRKYLYSASAIMAVALAGFVMALVAATSQQTIQRVTSFVMETSASGDRIRNSIDGALIRLDKVTAEADSARKKMKVLELRLKNDSSRRSENEKRIAEIGERLAALETKIRDVENALSGLQKNE